jgi:hypothetical protein
LFRKLRSLLRIIARVIRNIVTHRAP